MIGNGRVAAAWFLFGVVSLAARAQQELTVSIELPANTNWEVLTDSASGATYNREWIPAGSTYETADWLIAQQKIRLSDEKNPVKFLERIYAISAEACTSTSHDEPQRMKIGDHRVAIGRTMCARRPPGSMAGGIFPWGPHAFFCS